MKDVKVDVIIHYNSSWTFKAEKLEKELSDKIQARIDKFRNEGYRLISSNSSVYGAAVYTQLYFERV